MTLEELVPEKLKAIFDRLQDEESRQIFLYRLQYFLDGDERHLNDMLVYINKQDKRKCAAAGKHRPWRLMDLKHCSNEKTYICYGAGAELAPAVDAARSLGINITECCDSDPDKWGIVTDDGVAVISPDELLRKHLANNIIISTYMFAGEVYDYLHSAGFDDRQIFANSSSTFFEKQYFGPHFMEPVTDEVFIDAGCYDGDTIKAFLNFCKGSYKQIYGFEPDSEKHNSLNLAISDSDKDRITIIPKGVWSHEGILRFNDTGRMLQIEDDGEVSVPVTTIDSITKDDPVTLIKMDIEGSELEALKGASETIRRRRPRLAISVYHKPEDILEIPLLIQSFVPEYRFYIRHHDLSKFYETVLYAII